MCSRTVATNSGVNRRVACGLQPRARWRRARCGDRSQPLAHDPSFHAYVGTPTYGAGGASTACRVAVGPVRGDWPVDPGGVRLRSFCEGYAPLVDWGALWGAVAALDWTRIFGTLGTLVVSILALFKWGERQKALREQIAGELELLADVERNAILNRHTGAPAWLHGKIVLDIAKLTGAPLGARKKPIPWGSVILAAILASGLGVWTYVLNASGFVWYSLIPGVIAVLFGVSLLGMFTNREIPPDDALPTGAVPLKSDVAVEQIAGTIAKLSTKADESRFASTGVAGVALRVFETLQAGDFGAALDFVDPLWLECRLRSWLWNNYLINVFREEQLEPLLSSLKMGHQPAEVWDAFVVSEETGFETAWKGFGEVGAGTTRRRMSRNTELIILAPVHDSGGYFVPSATVLPRSLTFLMRETDTGWKLANHGGSALPLAEWPPVWWMVNDPAIGSEAQPLDSS